MFVYMDDLIVVSRDLDSHFEKLTLVFERLSQTRLKLNLQRCNFLKSRIAFFGHIVDHEGIHTSGAKVSAVKIFPTPKTADNVRSFLGFAVYYRAFVKDCFYCISFHTSKKDAPLEWQDA